MGGDGKITSQSWDTKKENKTRNIHLSSVIYSYTAAKLTAWPLPVCCTCLNMSILPWIVSQVDRSSPLIISFDLVQLGAMDVYCGDSERKPVHDFDVPGQKPRQFVPKKISLSKRHWVICMFIPHYPFYPGSHSINTCFVRSDYSDRSNNLSSLVTSRSVGVGFRAVISYLSQSYYMCFSQQGSPSSH